MRLGVQLAQEANRLPGLRGRERLELVLKMLRDLLKELPEETRKPLEVIVENVIPETVTLVVEASRGGFDLKKPSVGCVARLAVLLCRSVGAPPQLVAIATQVADAQEKGIELPAATPSEAKPSSERPPEPTSAPES
jgi:hypothetical protein